MILIASFPPGGASAIKQIRAAGIETPIVTDQAFDGSAWLSAIPNLSNTFVPNLASANGTPDPKANRSSRSTRSSRGKSVLAAYPAWAIADRDHGHGDDGGEEHEGKAVAAAIEKLKNFPDR